MHDIKDPVTIGFLTYANVDCDDDTWRWCIVTQYKGPQDYDKILCAFAEGYRPDRALLYLMLSAWSDYFDDDHSEECKRPYVIGDKENYDHD
jgi:hypothetical protein